MQDILLGIIAIVLTILAIELSIIFYYAVIFLRNAVFISERVKILEGSFEQKLEKLENELTSLSAKIIKAIIRRSGRFFKK